jgi:mono/diheme cytochrome c family protein
MKSKFIIVLSVIALSTFSLAFTMKQQKPWVVPDQYAKAKNPLKSDAGSIADGKSLWMMHCASCHGKTGLGDGTKAAQLKTQPNDFSKADFQSQSDGSVFYKISAGRDDMPSFKKKIPDDEDIWSLVVFIRTLKK